MEYEEFENDLRKEELFARSPLLRTFLSPRLDSDADGWLGEFEEKIISAQDEIAQHQKDDAVELSVSGWIESGRYNKVFPEDTDKPFCAMCVEAMLYIGYQLGNPDDAIEIFGEVLTRLDEVGIIRYSEDEAEMSGIATQAWLWILAGSYLKYMVTGQLPNQEPSEPEPQVHQIKIEDEEEIKLPDIFEDFINNKLNLRNPSEDEDED